MLRWVASILVSCGVLSSPSTVAGQIGDPEYRCDPNWRPPRAGAEHTIPIRGQIVHYYDAPEDNPYTAGHRGIDIAWTGNCIHAPQAGIVAFSGVVIGNRTLSIDHADLTRTTFSYIAHSSVVAGQAVLMGQPIGLAGDGHPNSGLPSHVHVSARRNGVYFDPLRQYVGASFDDLIELTN